MPTVFSQGRYRFFFFSNEGKEPVHIHIEAGGEYAKFWLAPLGLAGSTGFKPHELAEIRGIIEGRIDLIVERWNEHFSGA